MSIVHGDQLQHQSSFVTSITTQTTETVSTQIEPNTRSWKAREVLRLCQLPLDTEDPSPARVEACILRLNDRVKDLQGDEDVAVTDGEDSILKDIQRCEGRG